MSFARPRAATERELNSWTTRQRPCWRLSEPLSLCAVARPAPRRISPGYPHTIVRRLSRVGCSRCAAGPAPLPVPEGSLTMELGLADKVAVVTGASKGIGLAGTPALAPHGAH